MTKIDLVTGLAEFQIRLNPPPAAVAMPTVTVPVEATDTQAVSACPSPSTSITGLEDAPLGTALDPVLHPSDDAPPARLLVSLVVAWVLGPVEVGAVASLAVALDPVTVVGAVDVLTWALVELLPTSSAMLDVVVPRLTEDSVVACVLGLVEVGGAASSVVPHADSSNTHTTSTAQ